MTIPRLSIAYGDEPSRRSSEVSEILRSQGHDVVWHEDHRDFLSAPEPDLYVIGPRLTDGTRGLDLLESIRRAGRLAPIVILDERPSFADMRRAVELGASDLVLRPTDAGELIRAIERAHASRAPRPRIEVEPSAHTCVRSFSSDESTVGRAAREISAFLVNEGVVNAHRVRIATALAEVVDNACRHAYPRGTGEIVVRAEVQRTRVQVSVTDQGRGFDTARVRLERVPAALPGERGARRNPSPIPSPSPSSDTGLGRVERLCEHHELFSGPQGTRIELTFELTPVRFDEEAEHLAETDFLDPERARSLIRSVRKGRTDLSGVAPGMALTIGRILGGLDAPRSPDKK
jgi:anti-sigma regulatory factor (Ser/Thr protein kinase)/CheY-like chemotaxis protein